MNNLDSAVDVRLAAADQRTTAVELNKRRVQQPEITGNFTVARNALFFQTINSQQFATALHTDGSAVTAAKPAVAGQTISLLGTGFGPYRETVLDGFYPPSSACASGFRYARGQAVLPKSATAAPGYTAITWIQFQVPSGLPAGAPGALEAAINAVDNNTVLLPLL